MNNIDVHHLWWKLCNYMKKWYYTKERVFLFKTKKMGKRTYKFPDLSKAIGYDAICRMDKFVKKNPDVIDVRCDDSVHAGSDLYLIPHENKDEYWGTTVLFIPQCTNVQNEFFLYPNHLNKLIEELKKIQQRQNKTQ